MLTMKQEKFAVSLADGFSQADAYRQSYQTENMQNATTYVEASRLAAHPKVALRLEQLRREKDEDRHMQALRREDFVLDSLMHESINAKSDSARVRALELIGKTIGLFVDRDVEEAQPEPTLAELEEELMSRLGISR